MTPGNSSTIATSIPPAALKSAANSACSNSAPSRARVFEHECGHETILTLVDEPQYVPQEAPSEASADDPAITPEIRNRLFALYLESPDSLPRIAALCGLSLTQTIAWHDHPDTQKTFADLNRIAQERAEHRRLQSAPVAMSTLVDLAQQHYSHPETARKAAGRILTPPRSTAATPSGATGGSSTSDARRSTSASPIPTSPPSCERDPDDRPSPESTPLHQPTRERRAYHPITAITGVAGTHFPLRHIEVHSLAADEIEACARWPPGHPWPGISSRV